MREAFRWILFGNSVAAVAWRNNVPINTGPPYWLLAVVLYLHAWQVRPRRPGEPTVWDGVTPQRIGAAALAGLTLSSPALLFFRLPGVRERLAYPPIRRLSRAALAWRVLFEIPVLTALGEELLFRDYLPYHQRSRQPVQRVVANAAQFTAWHFVVSLRTVMDANFGRRRLGLAFSYGGSLLTVAVGSAVFHVVRERTGSVVCAAVTHWVADAALTVSAWLS